MADIFTSFIASGTESELTAMLNVLRKYSKEAKARYKASHDCWYLDTEMFDNLPPEKIFELIDGGKLNAMIPGPYGVVQDPHTDYNKLFIDLADVAPMSRFDGTIFGFDVGSNISYSAVLREGRLYFAADYCEHSSMGESQDSTEHAGGRIFASGDESSSLADLTFVITGDLKKFKNRDAITIFIEERGGSVGSSVTKNTNYLISNAKKAKTAKHNKAKELGTPVITEAEFLSQFGLEYKPYKTKNKKMYEAGYYDPILRKSVPARKLKREPLTLQLTFECTDKTHPIVQIDLDVTDFMGLSCTPEMILECTDLDELEKVLLDSVTDEYSYISNRDEHISKWRIDEFRSLLDKKWQPVKKAVQNMENIERIIFRRTDVRLKTRLVGWSSLFHPELIPLAKKAAICKLEQKTDNVAAFQSYIDEQKIWFPWSETPGWPSRFCGYNGKADLDWRSLTDDAEVFAKMLVTEDIPDLDHGEEITIVDLRTREYQQSSCYYPGW